jgi:hypothetical protein
MKNEAAEVWMQETILCEKEKEMGWHAICPDMLEGEAQEYCRRADGGSRVILTE